MLVWGTPRNAKLAWDAQGDVVAARMVGIRQEGNESLLDGTVRKGTRCANSCHDVTGKVRRLRVAALVVRNEKKKERKASLATSGKQDSQARGGRPPCSDRKALASGMG